jgi:hypothetical protein
MLCYKQLLDKWVPDIIFFARHCCTACLSCRQHMPQPSPDLPPKMLCYEQLLDALH